MWENQGYSLDPLFNYLKDVIGSIDQIKESDFEIPNHYALLAYKAGKKALAQEIQALLPKSCTE